jgi:lipopolysaccharide/colanic/teichoic acid biosynthesis glycosyltransferase
MRKAPNGLSPSTPSAHALGRRLFDILGAFSGAIILSPIIAAVILAIWLESGNPLLFGQTRLGLRGRQFRMYKFRKFKPDCAPDGYPLTMEKDHRLTRVGRVLAASKLDEIPQLWNELRGDMSIVGPRPESTSFADCFSNGFEGVLEHKPGLFGPSQVLFRYESQLYPENVPPVDFYRRVLFPTKAKIDIDYFSNRTFASDIRWIVRALLAIAKPSVEADSKDDSDKRSAGIAVR